MANPFDSMDLSHHAYCIIGGESARQSLLERLKEGFKVSPEGDPDFFDHRYHNLTIDDARAIKSAAETRPVTDFGKRVFVLLANGVTVEAQNALLKLMEEPPSYAHFFLIVPSAHLLLPTMKSRLSFISSGGIDDGGDAPDASMAAANEFLALAPGKRLDWVKSFMEEINKDKRPKQDAVDLLKSLEVLVARDGAKQNAKKLEAILLAEKYSTDRAPSMKMLLEYVAMSL